MEEIQFRTAQPADLPHILHHRLAMFEEMGHTDAGVLDRVRYLSAAYLHRALRAGSYHGWLAETAEGQVIGGGGIVIADWPGHPGEQQANRVWILNMYTEPAFRRRGIARRLMELMIAWCRAEGFTSVSLHASKDGRRLYEALGFQPTNEMRLSLTKTQPG